VDGCLLGIHCRLHRSLLAGALAGRCFEQSLWGAGVVGQVRPHRTSSGKKVVGEWCVVALRALSSGTL